MKLVTSVFETHYVKIHLVVILKVFLRWPLESQIAFVYSSYKESIL